MAKDTIKHAVEIQTGDIPQSITTGTTASVHGFYSSEITEIPFPKAFSRAPKVVIQENSGNADRDFRYRLINVTPTFFAVMLVANAPDYHSAGSDWIAIAE